MNAGTTDERPAVLAVDGGNSKADLVLVSANGRLLARVVGSTVSHQAVGFDAGLAGVDALAVQALEAAGFGSGRRLRPFVSVGSLCLAGADSPTDIRRLARALDALQLADRVIVRNDTEAPLRAGTAGWGVAVVCGTGSNALGRAPNGRVARFAGLGQLSGDFAGGGAVGLLALGAAAAAQERRGPRTSLERAVPAFFGLRRALDVTFAIEHGRISRARLRELAPLVFGEAAAGDPLARGIVDHLADEIVAFATAAIRRLGLRREAVPVILSGGIFRADDARFIDRIRAGVSAVAPAAQVQRLTAPPVLGAALLGLDAIDAGPAAEGRLRETLV